VYDVVVNRASGLAIGRLVFGLLGLAAMAYQFLDLAGKGTLDVVNYFSYFTIDSNLLAAAVLLIGASGSGWTRSPNWVLVRGAAVVYMSVTGIVFTLLLANTDVDTTIPWVNTVVHELIPLVMVADWLLDPPPGRLTQRQGLLWLGFPAVWIVYTMVRGAFANRYPYPFLHPANGGYATVAVYCVGILVVMAVVSALTVALGNFAAPQRRPEAAS